MELNERKYAILSGVIRLYTDTGLPVGSKVLLENMELMLSSATVRNEMNELCEMGLLIQPHISAGRIPSANGFLLYIDRLLRGNILMSPITGLSKELSSLSAATPSQLIETVCAAVADITGLAAIGSLDFNGDECISEIRLVPLGSTRIMVVLTTSGGALKSKTTAAEFVSFEAAEMFYALLKEHILNQPLSNIPQNLTRALSMMAGAHALTLAPLFEAVNEIISEIKEGELYIKGELNLLLLKEWRQNAESFADFLRDKNRIKQLLCASDEPVYIQISNGEDSLPSGSGLITAGIYKDGDRAGSISVLGPSRMDYSQIIPTLVYFNKSLEKALRLYVN